jgi:hypothetical protein
MKWHWLKYGDDRNGFLPDPALWKRNYWEVCGAKYSVTDTCGFGWRYLEPVLPPAKVQALRDENARLWAALKAAWRTMDACGMPEADAAFTVLIGSPKP